MSVSHIRPEVAAQSKRWNLVRDCIAGQDAIKRVFEASTRW